MRLTRAASLLLVPTFAIAALGTAGPAFAEDPAPEPVVVQTEPPAEPEEGDLDEEGAGELTAKFGNSCATTTPAHTVIHAKDGVYRLKSNGYSQYHANCTKGVKTNATLYSPRNVGWYIWETKA